MMILSLKRSEDGKASTVNLLDLRFVSNIDSLAVVVNNLLADLSKSNLNK